MGDGMVGMVGLDWDADRRLCLGMFGLEIDTSTYFVEEEEEKEG